jgi:hypothetical protein
LCRKHHGANGKLEEDQDTKGAMNDLKSAIDRAIVKARAANAPRLAEVKAQIAAAQLAKAALPKKQRGPYTQQIEALEKEERGLAVNLTGMMGVVKCKDDGLIFAGTSLFQYMDVQAEMPGAWHSPKTVCTLADKPDRKDFKVDVLDFARYGQGPLSSWPVEWEKLEQLSENSFRGDTDEVFYPPGSCAAQQMILLAMDHGDRPMGLTERYYTTNANAPPLRKLWIRKPGKGGPKRARLATPEELGPGKPIPPCGTCQVILTMLMCAEGAMRCEHKSAREGVCHKC